MNRQAIAILWFRQDLRLGDNPALTEAAGAGRVLPIYILDDDNAGDWAMGAASRAWLHHSLAALNHSLQGRLRLFRGDAAAVLRRLTQTPGVESLYWNRCYEPWRRERDEGIEQALQPRGVVCKSFNASLLWEPATIAKRDGTPYRVFTPFYQKGCLQAPAPRSPLPPPAAVDYYPDEIAGSLPLDSLALLPRQDWHRKMLANWSIGEDAARQKLHDFCDQDLADYRRSRDFPAQDSTSKLSPHLHFGEISPAQLWHGAQQAEMGRACDGAAHFRRELGWREFSHHLLYHFPQLPHASFNPRFDRFDWRQDAAGLRAWQRGLTGYPIIDAGMRELWQTGYMHNRVRMVVASFLIKNQLLHWRQGANWFWDCLVDADLANNSASWQWCAGSGADAAPYFRIFNPLLQSEKFDPAGEYLLRYCPELTGLPLAYRHKPWAADAATLRAAGIELGKDYPRPILDLKTTRERALERYKALA